MAGGHASGDAAMDEGRKHVRKAILDFLRRLVGDPNIHEFTDLRAAYNVGPTAWAQLALDISSLPVLKSNGYSIPPYAMEQVRTAHDIFRLLVSNQQQQQQQQRPQFASTLRELTPSATLDQAEYRVWYGTSRQPNDPSDPDEGYSSQRDSKIHYGSCTVYIPTSHKIGSVGSSWWKRLLTLTDDRLKLLRIQENDEASFWKSVAGQLDTVELGDRDALIYVHGYRVTFEEAALRAAQIGFDLSIKGAMAFFSWPSQGTLAGYNSDEATIEANEKFIDEFMTKFAAQSGAKAVHIVAHSMGNRGVLRAVNRIAQRATRETGIPFGQIILAAADVDADTFRDLCAAYTQVAARTTLYVSQRDLAVESSEWLHGFARVGLLPPVFVTPGIDTVNVTNADLTALGHGYVASARDVLQDMHDLIVHGAPPAKRFGLREVKSDDGAPYWLIGR